MISIKGYTVASFQTNFAVSVKDFQGFPLTSPEEISFQPQLGWTPTDHTNCVWKDTNMSMGPHYAIQDFQSMAGNR